VSKLKPNTYNGLQIGQFKVIGKGLFMIPRQYYLSFITILVTAGPALFQLCYNNEKYRQLKEAMWEAAEKGTGNNKYFEGSKDGLADPAGLHRQILIHDIFYALLLFLSLFFLVKACITDPGIIPRSTEENFQANYKDQAASSNGETRRRYFIIRK